jgi:xylan 1,4-beta-xylosidase
MNGQRVFVQSQHGMSAADIIGNGVRERNDIHAIASKNQNSICVMVWNYHDDNVAGPSSMVELTVDGMKSKKVLVHHYRVDNQFSNSFEKWKAMGRPQHVTDEQYRELERAGQLQLYSSPEWRETNNETVLKFELPRQAVSLLQLTW